ncbi:hypothetical protein TELCIR_09500 [Teladorsagia circumcincta]|uniref:Amiloride-sensitive sodium channel n=1 Tax=Teladorsagia circumcincta TaxID=45464 RepID=A0A2G9UGS2_TELCI|nr:hypothetical protein TELCIR_09500 [Teladorsagia circumcincta]
MSGYLLLGYHSKPTLFQVKTIVASDGVSFPDITICKHNPIEMSRLVGYNMSKNVLLYLLASFNDHVERDELDDGHRAFEDYTNNFRLQAGRNFSIADFFFDVRPTCEELVLSCLFAGEDINNCCANSEVVITDVGYCVRENISVVNIFFRSTTYERHEQQKQLQTADLLSNIAGSMGLFLGMSTVTLLEIFIYLFKSVWGTVNTERQKQFMEAMMEEENERRQSVVIVEEPHRQVGFPQAKNQLMMTLHILANDTREEFLLYPFIFTWTKGEAPM